MRFSIFSLIFLMAIQTNAQVVDVNGDGLVAAEEAIAVAEQWKGPASASDEHDHLHQIWEGSGIPLTMTGNFFDRFVVGTSLVTRDAAPLRLDNTRTVEAPDLELGGPEGVIYANGDSGSFGDLVLKGNRYVHLIINANGSEPRNGLFRLTRADEDLALFTIPEDGNAILRGSLSSQSTKTQIDHPQDPANKYLVHSSVESPDMKNVYDGVATLDDTGEAVVRLPDYIEAFNNDFRYQLTCIGGFAPVYVAEEIQDNEFKIAGGNPGMKVSWMVTGVRNDVYAKANPIEVEQAKSEEEKGKYLHPELFGEPVDKSVGLLRESDE